MPHRNLPRVPTYSTLPNHEIHIPENRLACKRSVWFVYFALLGTRHHSLVVYGVKAEIKGHRAAVLFIFSWFEGQGQDSLATPVVEQVDKK